MALPDNYHTPEDNREAYDMGARTAQEGHGVISYKEFFSEKSTLAYEHPRSLYLAYKKGYYHGRRLLREAQAAQE